MDSSIVGTTYLSYAQERQVDRKSLAKPLNMDLFKKINVFQCFCDSLGVLGGVDDRVEHVGGLQEEGRAHGDDGRDEVPAAELAEEGGPRVRGVGAPPQEDGGGGRLGGFNLGALGVGVLKSSRISLDTLNCWGNTPTEVDLVCPQAVHVHLLGLLPQALLVIADGANDLNILLLEIFFHYTGGQGKSQHLGVKEDDEAHGDKVADAEEEHDEAPVRDALVEVVEGAPEAVSLQDDPAKDAQEGHDDGAGGVGQGEGDHGEDLLLGQDRAGEALDDHVVPVVADEEQEELGGQACVGFGKEMRLESGPAAAGQSRQIAKNLLYF